LADLQTVSLCLIVLAADALFGGLPGLRQLLSLPLGAVAALGGWFEARLNRARRSDANRTVRGALVVVIVGVLAWAAGAGLMALAAAMPLGWIVTGVVFACLVYQRRLIVIAGR
jgi:cobalamin biosynthesis protein CobD/CbiB